MRMLMQVNLPNEEFNEALKEGTAQEKIQRALEQCRPESVYFTNYDGKRCAMLIVNLEDPSKVPSLAEPWFLGFHADVHFHVVITPDELRRSALDTIGKEWR